jgi:hypothetical protein
MQPDDCRHLLDQLARLPGGAAAAIPDFFASALAMPVDAAARVWPLKSGGELRLEDDGRLLHIGSEDSLLIVTLPAEREAQIRAAGGSPMLLTLLAIAVGHLDDQRHLKQRAPRIDGAAKDLMLMTVCRLCG